MAPKADPQDLHQWFADIRAYWCEAELNSLYGLSLAGCRTDAMPSKERRRFDTQISLHLSRTAARATELRKYLDAGYGPADIIADTLPRIANAEATWRKLLAIVRAWPIVPDVPQNEYKISGPKDLPRWLLKLQEFARPEFEVIADLQQSIQTQSPRSDEALDQLQWSAEDDLDAVALVLRLAENWQMNPDTKAHLVGVSAQARTQLEALLDMVEKARPFSIEMQIAKELAMSAAAEGQKFN